MKTVEVNGMSCQHCAKSVTDALSKIDGISNVVVDLEKKCATYEDSKDVDSEEIRKVISKIGFEPGKVS
ncbi:heavy-metal-associated domain-containing protein [Maridesulfovibrio bastinii]|uniref:heavy-metal-associated domain-containing protein n=1 Tax=Maridesulfovibrio bastinii TaxID=47157 RepID=UPI000425B11E|nr:heavy metal-associated domain-containing protein [Maridesulfovibrio bastinii]